MTSLAISSPFIQFYFSLQTIEDISNKNEEDISNHKTLLENTISTHKKDLEVLEIIHNSHVKQQLSALKGQLDTIMSLEKERGLRLLSDLRAEQVREVFELKEQHDMNVQAALNYQKERMNAEVKGKPHIIIHTHMHILTLILTHISAQTSEHTHAHRHV